MSGIKMISERAGRATSSERSGSSSLRRELWLRDGDQAFLTSVATGDDDDPFWKSIGCTLSGMRIPLKVFFRGLMGRWG